jgi:hypothetical protein
MLLIQGEDMKMLLIQGEDMKMLLIQGEDMKMLSIQRRRQDNDINAGRGLADAINLRKRTKMLSV